MSTEVFIQRCFLGSWKYNLQCHLIDLWHCSRLGGPTFVFQLENPKANRTVIQITWTCFFWYHLSSFLALGSISSLADLMVITSDTPFYLLGLWCICKEKPKSFPVLSWSHVGHCHVLFPYKHQSILFFLPQQPRVIHVYPHLPSAQGMLLQGPNIQQTLTGEPDIPEQVWPRAARVDYGIYSRT